MTCGVGVTFGVVCLIFGAANLAGGVGLWNLKSYGRIVQIVNGPSGSSPCRSGR